MVAHAPPKCPSTRSCHLRGTYGESTLVVSSACVHLQIIIGILRPPSSFSLPGRPTAAPEIRSCGADPSSVARLRALIGHEIPRSFFRKERRTIPHAVRPEACPILSVLTPGCFVPARRRRLHFTPREGGQRILFEIARARARPMQS